MVLLQGCQLMQSETPAGDMAPYTSKEMVISEANGEEK